MTNHKIPNNFGKIKRKRPTKQKENTTWVL